MGNNQTKMEKTKQKRYAKFLKYAKVPKDAQQEEIDRLLLEFVGKMRKNFDKVELSDSQLQNPSFLLSLYKTNYRIIDFLKPQTKALLENATFMAQFILYKLRDGHKVLNFNQEHLEAIAINYSKAFNNPLFVEELAKLLPEANVIKVVYEALRGYCSDKETQKDYVEYISNLSKEFLCDQARIFGEKALRYIPSSTSGFNEMVQAGIEKDGFNSLLKLDVDQILDNKPLIFKAYQKEGIEALLNYINNSLSPYREYLSNEGDLLHMESKFDQKYSIVQYELMQDDTIKEIAQFEKTLKAKIEK